MAQMGLMAGRAVTVVFEPSNPEHRRTNPNAWTDTGAMSQALAP